MEINVKEFRTTVGLSQENLARRLGVSLLSVHNWEAGRTKPSQMAQAAILRFKRGLERARRD
jgi:DNA-binding transcriptional regulator YiaG